MKIIIKKIESFPNWALAVEFLRRSSMHYLVSEEIPLADVPPVRQRQIILRGVNHADYVCVPRHFDDAKLETLCAVLSDQVQTEARPFVGSVHSSNFMAFLHEFARMLKGKFELKEVAQVITDKTCELFNAEGVSILVPTPDGKKFRFAYHHTLDHSVGRRLSKIEVAMDHGVAGWVNKNRKSILINDVTKGLIFNADVDETIRFKTEEIMAAPIALGDNLLGIIEVLNRRDGEFQESDLQTIELIASIIAVFIQKANLYEEKIKFAKLHKEFEIAHDLQTRIMPALPTRIGPFRLMGESRQLSKVGGDFWDIFSFNENEKLLIIGDVSGHGLSAALMMFAVRTVCRALLRQVGSPYDLIGPLNDLVHAEFNEGGHYATLILCHLVLDEEKIKFFRAGHEKPVLKTSGGYDVLDKMGGLPIGVFPFRKSDPWEELTIGPEDRLFLYTDGVIDGLDHDDFSVAELLEQNPELEDALEEGRFFHAMRDRLSWRLADDATFLMLTRDEVSAS